MGSPDHNFAFNRNDRLHPIDISLYATKLSNVQRDLDGCHGLACLVQIQFFCIIFAIWHDDANG